MADSEVLRNMPFNRVTDAELTQLVGVKSKSETNSIEGNEFYNYLVSVSKSDIFRGLNFNYCSADEFDGLCNNTVSYTHLTLPTNREV